MASVRRVPLNWLSVTGWLPSRKNGRLVALESTLERDFYTLLEFDTEVVSYDEQPVQLKYRNSKGRKISACNRRIRLEHFASCQESNSYGCFRFCSRLPCLSLAPSQHASVHVTAFLAEPRLR